MNDCILAQRRFFSSGNTFPLASRLDSLRRLRGAIESHEAELLAALRADLGKPEFEAFVSEIGFIYEDLRYVEKNLKRWMRPEKFWSPLTTFPARSFLYREPLGVVLIIAPWNYPFQLLMAPLVGALAAGNCAVLKPSELAPHTSAVIQKLISSAFPEEIVAVVEGGKAETEALLAEKFDHIFFTGGSAVGKIILAKAAETLTPVTLELGGKSPCIVDSDADLETAAKRIVWGKFFNAGQTCVAPDYLLVQNSVRVPLVEKLQAAVLSFYGADPRMSPDYARIINDRHFSRLVGLLQGQKLFSGGQSVASERYLAPTILEPANAESPVMQEEIFGPILPVVSYDRLEDAMGIVRSRSKPLALYYFSRDASRQKEILEKLSFGGGCVNDVLMHLSDPNLPFGGVGESGMGAYHGKRSFEVFSHAKGVLKKSARWDLPFRYPPYGARMLAFVKRIQKGARP